MATATLPFLVHDVGAFDHDDPHSQYSIASQTLVDETIEVLADYRCFETPQGWVLALDPVSLRTFLWRPEDGERIALPSMEKNLPLTCKCILSGKPGSSSTSCVVMVFDLHDFAYWVCPIGGNKWERHGYSLTIYDAKDQPKELHVARRHGMAAVGGKVYFELSGSQLGVVEFDPVTAEPNLIFMEVDMVDTPETMPMWSSYLVESCEELFLVVVFFQGENVHKVAEVVVYKMDFSVPAWRKVDRIGDDRVFLLGGHDIGISSFGASYAASACGLTGNCIYFLNHAM
ncbi:hypothetical protein EJB05_33668 [Eragrostis curvula]|uniref:KIB1-4 beta-propeller domain-containing protein n=1 Tax=Eragrostis curvula TaxID=38414 RepID=A0A5J9U399_9POAL|nr:hypothetical protein EJB05_33668 [Eragrostis curvula]